MRNVRFGSLAELGKAAAPDRRPAPLLRLDPCLLHDRRVLGELGPEGGAGGGTVVAEGPPETVGAVAASYTAHYLQPVLVADVKRRGKSGAEAPARAPRGKKASGDLLA